jgi:hypothetical protein
MHFVDNLRPLVKGEVLLAIGYQLSVEDGKTARRQDGKTARRQGRE